MDIIKLIIDLFMILVYIWLGVSIIFQIYYLVRIGLLRHAKPYSYTKTKIYHYLVEKYNGLAEKNFWVIVKLLIIVLAHYLFQ